MWLQKLLLTNFRSYKKEEVSFSNGINCIQGKNAEGKTNLLEAIHVVSTGKSFRTHHLQDLIHSGATGFQIEAFFMKSGVSQSLHLSFDGQTRKIRHNSTSHASFLPLLGILPSILLVPEDISILSGSPSERRRFLDLHIAQLDPVYVYHLGRYYKAMKQRNYLLKKQDEQALFPWEYIMAQSSAYLIEKRLSTVDALYPFCASFVETLSEQKEHISLSYHSTLQLPSSSTKLTEFYLEQWAKTRKRDLSIGSTMLGPHRDDLLFLLEGKEVNTFCSEGQKRGFVAALKLAELHIFQSHFGSLPLLGIDDFGIHLDAKRLKALSEHIGKLGQVFLTAPSFTSFPQGFFLNIIEGSVTTNTMTDAENTLVLQQTV